IESRSPDPLIPLSVWRRPTFTASVIVNFAFNGLMVGLLYLLALYLQTARGLSAIAAAAEWVATHIAGRLKRTFNTTASPLIWVGTIG
ncbi:MAG: hypothetical protein ACKOTA_07320, partial [Solirubrobacterales bacterium]